MIQGVVCVLILQQTTIRARFFFLLFLFFILELVACVVCARIHRVPPCQGNQKSTLLPVLRRAPGLCSPSLSPFPPVAPARLLHPCLLVRHGFVRSPHLIHFYFSSQRFLFQIFIHFFNSRSILVFISFFQFVFQLLCQLLFPGVNSVYDGSFCPCRLVRSFDLFLFFPPSPSPSFFIVFVLHVFFFLNPFIYPNYNFVCILELLHNFILMQVGQEVFSELSQLETRGFDASPPQQQQQLLLHRLAISTIGEEAEPRAASGGDGGGRSGGGAGEAGGAEGVTTRAKDIVDACVRVLARLEGCPQARHYVMSADR